jgi:hypothetical protein
MVTCVWVTSSSRSQSQTMWLQRNLRLQYSIMACCTLRYMFALWGAVPFGVIKALHWWVHVCSVCYAAWSVLADTVSASAVAVLCRRSLLLAA